ncbi:D-beta-hydroxybutyrate dehydrogenase, mitochondrial [Tribolium madens]|uniref:D-beta-hydroxybutyrate dehydrogenase, mitochondrial n=1 Tax=Tribolium madens TaxID=41895 RepID=UPI001CF748D4|nr:D-beta-hydroxybutyrate dehydrogenase, mitochondrial [Tribolium madens]XP_044255290.1 D-beta-hydroxybutyrate dehydrogenase, mitochondrial [Tribolium madens]
MDEQTALVLALQLVALFSIAGALLCYLLCKIRAGSGPEAAGSTPGGGKAVLVTCADNSIGLQLAVHLANRGFRVFAGLKDGASSGSSDDSVSSRVIRAWQKHRESLTGLCHSALVALPLDVTREDLLHEAVDIIRAHLPAGEDGIWAVINTSGLSYRGRLDQQDIAHWDAILKTNVVGVLRTTRTFQGLLRNTSGRLINFGVPDSAEAGLVAYTASRYAVEGASNALRQELAPMGIKVITLHLSGVTPEMLFVTPKLNTKEERGDISVDMSGCIEYQPILLTPHSLRVVDVAVTAGTPNNCYDLAPKGHWTKPINFIKSFVV